MRAFSRVLLLLGALLACVCIVGGVAASASSSSSLLDEYSFLSEPATDLQPFFNADDDQSGWLGADTAVSVPSPVPSSSASASGGTSGVSDTIWLFSDTLVGHMLANGSRWTDAMPRNSLALFSTNSSGGPAQKTLRHFQPATLVNDTHTGFFSPRNESNWFWLTGGGIMAKETLFVLAAEMYTAAPGQWGFAQWAMSCVLVTVDPNVSPLEWQQKIVPILPKIFPPNSEYGMGTSITDGGDGYIYMLGFHAPAHAEPKGDKLGLMYRMGWDAFIAQDWSGGLMVQGSESTGGNSSVTWLRVSTPGSLGAATRLFHGAPSETTVQWSPYLQRWVLLLAITFQSPFVQMRVASTLAGPWSEPIDLYKIPESSPTVFCYSAKGHPEFLSSPDAPELVFSYMCNSSWEAIQIDSELYVPRMIRTKITQNIRQQAQQATEGRIAAE